jgi:hypothetical protein
MALARAASQAAAVSPQHPPPPCPALPCRPFTTPHPRAATLARVEKPALVAGALRGLHLALKHCPEVVLKADAQPALVAYPSSELWYYVLRAAKFGLSKPGRRIASEVAEVGLAMLSHHMRLFAPLALRDAHPLFDLLLRLCHLHARVRVRSLAPGALTALLQCVAAHLSAPDTSLSAAGAGAGGPAASTATTLRGGRGTAGGAGGKAPAVPTASSPPPALHIKAEFQWFMARFTRMVQVRGGTEGGGGGYGGVLAFPHRPTPMPRVTSAVRANLPLRSSWRRRRPWRLRSGRRCAHA